MPSRAEAPGPSRTCRISCTPSPTQYQGPCNYYNGSSGLRILGWLPAALPDDLRAAQSWDFTMYAQDDWKMTSNLTPEPRPAVRPAHEPLRRDESDLWPAARAVRTQRATTGRRRPWQRPLRHR